MLRQDDRLLARVSQQLSQLEKRDWETVDDRVAHQRAARRRTAGRFTSGSISDPDWRMIVGTPVPFPAANADRQHAIRHVLHGLGSTQRNSQPEIES